MTKYGLFLAFCTKNKIKLCSTQLEAVKAFYKCDLNSQGRGAGKTYILKVMVEFDKADGSSYCLLSPETT